MEFQAIERIEEEREARYGQGFASSSEVRCAVENHAVQEAIRHFESEGFKVQVKGKPYDLYCSRQGEEVFVEVKGTCGSGQSVFLTRNEVSFAREHRKSMCLFILANIRLDESEKGPLTSGGTTLLRRQWNVEEGDFRRNKIPVSTNYRRRT